MISIDRTFKDRLVKWTIVLSVILECIMVIINFPDIGEIIQYCLMGLVIIAFVLLSEVRAIAFGLKHGIIVYTDKAREVEEDNLARARELLEGQLEKLNNT